MTTFVLVHGAWHGAWAWYKVVPRLENAGHEVVAVDLPGHGTDTGPVAEATLEDFVDRVDDAVRETDSRTVLVGHSMAGMVITGVAERSPEAVDALVYLSAFLPESGESLLDYAQTDEESVVTRNFQLDEEAGLTTVADDAIDESFYADCSPEDVTLARSLLRPESLAAMSAPVETTEDQFGSVRRVYVSCTADRAITPEAQERMYEALPCAEVHTLDTSHSPFLSAPGRTAEVLLETA
ncbi:alpha/beta fold hydrolase (plasmid) [Halobaculum sp. CBA1158]|uniref:alpha/beta fold hydrolase n=1 Tax=Halobaculum sp. CBA1158 TaxID=2904243 RepID=UPI001F2742ED|nr:alpha/beta fold hydrolase [Halobaculum sp. CBA1158]UIP01478.1 alpha/beta fold hydrolase [Halobaculum sp. CBA1158]